MFGKILLLSGLLLQIVSGRSLRNPMTTVIPRPHITIQPTENINYRQLPNYGMLYY